MTGVCNRLLLLGLTLLSWLPGTGQAQTAENLLGDKTLIVWVSLATLDQRGGSALTIDNGDGAFDGVVFGEVEPKRWMPGSNNFERTERNQVRWPAETATTEQFVQIAIVYSGREISMFRNGKPYAKYVAGHDPQQFGPRPTVLFGRRHIDAGDRERSITGLIKDARIYAQPLAQAAIAGLRPGRISRNLKPWAWWSFADEGLPREDSLLGITGLKNRLAATSRMTNGHEFFLGDQPIMVAIHGVKTVPAHHPGDRLASGAGAALIHRPNASNQSCD